MAAHWATLQKKVSELSQELNQLKEEKKQLQQQLQGSSASATGYLYKFRAIPWAAITSDWELRYFVLTGNLLKYYESDKDTNFNPREEHDLTGCTVQWEGLQQKRYWTFTVYDSSDICVIKLSSLSKATAEQWIAALEKYALCPRRAPPSPPEAAEAASAPMRKYVPMISIRRDTVPSFTAASVPPPIPPPIPEPTAPPPTTAATTEGATAAIGTTSPAVSNAPTPTPRGTRRGPLLGSTPIHTTTRYSYLSSERHWQEKHTGLYNLALVILFATNFRLALENALKYGWRVNPLNKITMIVTGHGNLALAMCYPLLALLCGIAVAAEHLAVHLLHSEQELELVLSKKEDQNAKDVTRALARVAKRHERLLFIISFINTSASLLLPCLIVTWTEAEPIAGGILATLALVAWMKLISYAHCNADLRRARRNGEVRPGERGGPDGNDNDWAVLQYPENLTLANMGYFLLAPTLCYQVNYPRSPKIRKRWLARRFLELVVSMSLLAIIIEQYIEPAVANSIKPLQQMNYPRILERILKLSIPNLYAWLCFFYCLFHVWLNILAEILRFGDREFYKDWWNAATVGDYWKLWNMPVHQWLLRHVYYPMTKMGIPRLWTMIAVFFVSAVAHELAVGVPLHMVRFWAFAGIMGQIPLIMITEEIRKRLKRDDWGNYVFWITFCIVGQPVSMLMYYHDYMVEHGLAHAVTATLLGNNNNATMAAGSAVA